MNKLFKTLITKRDGGASSSTTTSTEGITSNNNNSTSQDILLTLTHLRKVFYEYQHPKIQWTQQDKNDRLYSTLPMVIKVLSVLTNNEWEERFPELSDYTFTLAKLLVYEIRMRADKEPNTCAASQAIIEYLEMNDEINSLSGWSLLRSLKLLSTGPNFIMDKFAQASLPSTFVKCLYLFFDLPEILITNSNNDVILPKEKRILLQQIFFQLLSRIAMSHSCVDELTRRDDLLLLFNAISSNCPERNIPWRMQASEMLILIGKHSLQPAIQCIHSARCISQCVENIRRATCDLSLMDIARVYETLICLIIESASLSSALMDDFRLAHCYVHMKDIILRLENEWINDESEKFFARFITLLGDFTYAGHNELKLPGRPETIIDIPNFVMPQPKKTGFIVRNISAFTILQSIFQQSTYPFLVNIVFDTISSVILADNANYFLCGENLSPITEILYNKPNNVQLKIYDLLEFIVFQLKYIPHRELVNLSIMLKSHNCVQSHKNCVKYLIHILKFNNVLKDALRELGFIEVLITRLHHFATLLKESVQDPNDKGDNMDQEEKELGFMVMEALALLLSHNQKNAKIFREHGGARLAHNIIPYRLCRVAALTVVLHLVLCTGGEDDTGTLLGLIHTAKLEELEMKSVILKGFLYILRESHRTRTVFRKVGGFVYIVSLLISMEGCLAVPPKHPWTTVSRHEILSIIRLILNTLTVAMRFEPGNARLFENEVRWQSLSDAIKLLGCFTNETRLTDSIISSKFDYASKHNYEIFEQLFYSLNERILSSTDLPLELINACHIARCFHDIALDCIDKSLVNPNLKNEPIKHGTSMDNNEDTASSPLFRTSALSMSSAARTSATFTFPSYMDEPIIVYPGAIVCFLQIISTIPRMMDEQYSNRLQYFLMLTLKNLLKYDRNLQIMATYGFSQHIIHICEVALQNENHHLHTSVEYIFERLATFILPVRTLRQFLRMGIDSIMSSTSYIIPSKDVSLINKSFVPLNRIKCLVSMTTLRDIRRETQVLLSSSSPTGILTNISSIISPSFVEFNMGIEGFGALLLPCLSPQSITSSSNVVGNFGMVTMTNDIILQGGMTLTNGGERQFPPQYGMTYSTWFYVEKFGPIKENIHPIRLLSIIRHTFNREDYRFVLQVYIHPKDKSLLVSTHEHPFQDCHNDSIYTDDIKSDGLVKFICSEMMLEQRWTHITLVWAKGMLKNSAVTLYINGKQIAVQKLHYINNMTVPPGNSISTFAYIGSLPVQRVHSSVQWRQGPCFLIDDILSSQIILAMYVAGPTYIGSFQAVCIDPINDVFSPLFPEDRIIFGLHPASFFETTLSHFKKLYNKNDAKLIAKQLNMPTNESTVPIRILYNIAAPYNGPARTIGGVVIGYLGVRIFVPNPVSKTIEYVGGPNVMLGLIAMSNDIESFYASVKAFVCILKSNKQIQNELLRTRAYQILGFLFLKKRHLINSHILHLTCTLVGTIDTIRESTAITNPAAFEHLLCEFEIWKGASVDIQKSLFDHLLDVFLTSDTQNLMMNQKLAQKINLMSRLLYLLKDGSLYESTRLIIISLIRVLLVTYKNTNDILKLGQFLVYLLPSSSISEKNINIYATGDDLSIGIQNIILRNFLLEMLARTIAEEKRSQTNLTDEFLTHLGYDWLLLFLQSHLHPRTIILTTKLLIAFLLSSSNALTRFRDNAMLLVNPSMTSNSSTSSLTPTGFTISSPTLNTPNATPISPLSSINDSWINVFNDRPITKPTFALTIDPTLTLGNNTNVSIPLPGFVLLQYIYAQRSEIVPIYYQLTGLLFRQMPSDDIMEQTELTVEKLLKLINIQSPLTATVSSSSSSSSKQQSSNQQQQQYELDACSILLAMIRNLASQENEQAEQNGLAVLRFFHQLYRRKSEFFNYAQTVEYLSFLCATVFPPIIQNQMSFESPHTFTRQKNIASEESVSSTTQLDSLIAAFTSNITLRGTIVDIIRDIIIDSLYSNTTRIPNVIDFFLSALPENMNSDLTYQIFVQCVFKSIIEYLETSELCPLISSDDQTNVLHFGLGDESGRTTFSRTFSSITSNNSSTNFNMSSYKLLLENVTHYIERMVDKIWDIEYREPKHIFEFIIKIINQAKKRGTNTFMDSLFRSLNRTILFELSRKIDSFGDQMTALDALHRLANNRQLIFSDSNQDVEFFGCLCYCLIILIDETGTKQFSDDSSSRSTWYHRLDSPTTSMQPNKSLIINAAQRIWSELYMKKKPALEEVLKMNFSQLVIQNKTTLVDVSEYLFESASKVWTRFIEGELRITDKIQQQIMHVGSRIQRLTGGVTVGFRSSLHQLRGTKSKREQVKLDRATIHSALALMSVNVSSVKENVDNEYRRLAQNSEQKFSYLYEEWLAIEYDLLRERGLWGFDEPDPLAKYKLDFIEGPCRMRKRMVLNEDFYKHYPYRIPIEQTKRKFNPPISFDSKQYFDRQSQVVTRLLITNTPSIDNSLTSPLAILKETNELSSPPPLPTISAISKETDESPPSPTEQIVRQDSEIWTNDEEKGLLAPTLLSVRKKTLSNEKLPTEEPIVGDDDEEDPMVANLELDEIETEAETQQTPTTPNETLEMAQTNQNVLRLLEEDEKISLAFRCARIEGLDGSEGILIFGREHFYILEGYTYNTEKNEIVDLDKCRNEYIPLIPKSSTITNADSLQYRKECSKFAYEDIKEVHKRRHILQPIALELFAADGRNYLLVFVRKERNKVYQRLLSSATELTDSAIHSVSGQRRSINIEQGTSFIGTLMGERSVTQRWEKGEISNFQYLMYLNTLAGRSYNDLMQYPVFPWILADYDSKELNLTNPITFRDLSKPMGAQTIDRLVQFQKRFVEWDDPTGSTPAYHYGTHYSSAMIVASYLVRTEPFTQVFLRLQGGHFDLADRMFHSIKDSWLSASRNNMADVKELIPEFFYLPDFLLNTNKFDLGKKQNGLALNDVILPAWSKSDPREFIRIHRMALESDYVSAHLNEWIDLIFGYKQEGPAAIEATNVFHHLFYEGAVNVDDISDPLERSAIIGFINNFGQIPKQLFKRPHPQKRLSRSLMDSIGIERNLFFNHVNSLRPSRMPIKELKSAVGIILPTEKSLIALEQCKAIIPPNYSRCIQYGFPDESLRIMSVDSDKSSMIYELVQDGKITNVLCPTSQYVITAGTNTLINVWEIGKGRHKRLHLKTRLTGHNDIITYLTASQAYRILISGSDDQTCIVWDLNRLHFIRQLPNHAGSISCICVNELTGDIASAAGSYLYVWTINGQLLASINTMAYSRQQSILCVAMSQMNEWDDENVIITGSSDGVVRMWTIGYDQVLDAPPSSPSMLTLGEDRGRLPSISQPSPIKLQSSTGQISIDSDAESDEGEGKTPVTPTQTCLSPQVDPSFDDDGELNINKDTLDVPSATSLNSPTGSDKFIVVTDVEILEAKSNNNNNNNNNNTETQIKSTYLDLKEGFKWDRRLNYRGKLTMHTAYERKENPSPAAVTAIGISKDHKTVFVGDARGRIFSWTVSDNPGRTNADHWIKDETVGACKDCSIRFSFAERRHHCRNCGQLFCARCSRFETDIPRMKIYKNVRVCRQCYSSIKEQRSLTTNNN
ncbi:unnamed protein product [Rotaria sordida]|uniref:WD repeat and FYVE domain-containing protein 3 n=1 Tax=Rotaria sordida TaxID=392033 RepID=A0A818TMS6_9BILA|nr:unnamed protein product [Rotaria sordida]CAF3685899.1 unnamed protein product [Rotaria sordida]